MTRRQLLSSDGTQTRAAPSALNAAVKPDMVINKFPGRRKDKLLTFISVRMRPYQRIFAGAGRLQATRRSYLEFGPFFI